MKWYITKPRYPHFIGYNGSKLTEFFRMRRQYPMNDSNRYPLNKLFPFKCYVSFGSRKLTPQDALRINTPAAIRNSADKVRTKDIWTIHDIPHTGTSWPLGQFIKGNMLDLTLAEQLPFPVLAKLRDSHGGRGMHLINDIDGFVSFIDIVHEKRKLVKNIVDRYFFEQVWEFHREFRIHASPHLKEQAVVYRLRKAVLRDGAWEKAPVEIITRRTGVIHEQEKLRRRGSTPSAGNNFTQGNTVFTSQFTVPLEWPEIQMTALKAIEVLGLDFGFVDILYNNFTGQYIFCESGSNPGMDQNTSIPVPNVTAQCYQQALSFIILNKALKTPGFYWK